MCAHDRQGASERADRNELRPDSKDRKIVARLARTSRTGSSPRVFSEPGPRDRASSASAPVSPLFFHQSWLRKQVFGNSPVGRGYELIANTCWTLRADRLARREESPRVFLFVVPASRSRVRPVSSPSCSPAVFTERPAMAHSLVLLETVPLLIDNVR